MTDWPPSEKKDKISYRADREIPPKKTDGMLSDLKHSAYGTGWQIPMALPLHLGGGLRRTGFILPPQRGHRFKPLNAMDLIREHCLPCHQADKAERS